MGLRNPLCEKLGIAAPSLPAGMAGMFAPNLVAAGANAGAPGILGGHNIGPDELRSLIEETHRPTSQPIPPARKKSRERTKLRQP
ncbi:MAG: hypothetical protein ACO1SV_10955 [Fimbriimonas sp.]